MTHLPARSNFPSPPSRTPVKLFMRIFIFVFTSIHLPSTSVQRLSSQSSIVSISVSVVSLANCRSVWGQLANYVNTHTLTHTGTNTHDDDICTRTRIRTGHSVHSLPAAQWALVSAATRICTPTPLNACVNIQYLVAGRQRRCLNW